MKALTTFASAVVLAATLAVLAVPAHATVFADFTPDTNANDYKWVNNGALDTGTGGHFSISNVASTVAQGVKTHFSFLDPALSALAFIPATFTIDATVASGNPANFNGGSGTWTQTALNGNFSFIYTGVTINNYLGSGMNLLNGSNLLSGVFTGAWIQGGGGSFTNLAIGNGGSASYNSDYEQFANLANNSEEFAFNLLAVTPNFGGNSGVTALNHFVANGGGNFSFETVPEPATWGLMIMGFGGLGVVLRNRRRLASA